MGVVPVLVPAPQAASKFSSKNRASMHIKIRDRFLLMMYESSLGRDTVILAVVNSAASAQTIFLQRQRAPTEDRHYSWATPREVNSHHARDEPATGPASPVASSLVGLVLPPQRCRFRDTTGTSALLSATLIRHSITTPSPGFPGKSRPKARDL
jgi:hypothetical protein